MLAEKLNQAQTVEIAKKLRLVVLHTSTPSFKMDVRHRRANQGGKPSLCESLSLVVTATAVPEQTLKASTAIDIAARKSSTFP